MTDKSQEASAPPQYTQPGVPQPAGTYPSEPPPQYEPPKQPSYQQGYQAGYPPQAGYPQQVLAAPVTVVTNQVHVLPHERFGPNPVQIQCPKCHANISTSTYFETGGLTWLVAGLCCIVGCWLGCCLIPFCMNDLQDCVHKCPNCNQQVGVYRRMS